MLNSHLYFVFCLCFPLRLLNQYKKLSATISLWLGKLTPSYKLRDGVLAHLSWSLTICSTSMNFLVIWLPCPLRTVQLCRRAACPWFRQWSLGYPELALAMLSVSDSAAHNLSLGLRFPVKAKMSLPELLSCRAAEAAFDCVTLKRIYLLLRQKPPAFCLPSRMWWPFYGSTAYHLCQQIKKEVMCSCSTTCLKQKPTLPLNPFFNARTTFP